MPQELNAYPLANGLSALVAKDMRPVESGSTLKPYVTNSGELGTGSALTLQQCATWEDQGGHCPAESIIVQGQAMLRLRDALLKEFPVTKEINPISLFKVVPHMLLSLTFGLEAKFDKDFVLAIGRDLQTAGFDVAFETLPELLGDKSRTWVRIDVRKP